MQVTTDVCGRMHMSTLHSLYIYDYVRVLSNIEMGIVVNIGQWDEKWAPSEATRNWFSHLTTHAWLWLWFTKWSYPDHSTKPGLFFCRLHFTIRQSLSTIHQSPSWELNTSLTVGKAQWRLYFLPQLKKFDVSHEAAIHYKAVIHHFYSLVHSSTQHYSTFPEKTSQLTITKSSRH